MRRVANRRRRNLDIRDDVEYSALLQSLSDGSVRRSFGAYTDIDWHAPTMAIAPGDPRWLLPESEPLARHPLYRGKSLDTRIALGMREAAHVAKVSLQFESILVRGLMQYSFSAPNGSLEYRYALHEAAEEINHSLMFQELVNRIGVDATGMPAHLRWVSSLLPLAAGSFPNTFFFGVLAGEVPIDQRQRCMLRDAANLHPAMATIIAVHVAEEARHISFADECLRRRVPRMTRFARFFLSLYVPLVMRVLHGALVPSRPFFRAFDLPTSVRRQVYVSGPEARSARGAAYGDVRMLCHDIGLMNPVARLTWRLCGVDGRRSRYRGEPPRHAAAVGDVRRGSPQPEWVPRLTAE